MTKPIRSRASAIAAKCKDCNYSAGEPGTWRQQIGACTITSCALHEFRPMPREALTVPG